MNTTSFLTCGSLYPFDSSPASATASGAFYRLWFGENNLKIGVDSFSKACRMGHKREESLSYNREIDRMNIQQVANRIVAQSIDMNYVTDCGCTTVSAIYQSEFGYNGLSDKSCKDYLQGLPSVCTVPFYNNEIIALFENNGITRKLESAYASLIDQYWNACGKALHAHIRKENLKNNA